MALATDICFELTSIFTSFQDNSMKQYSNLWHIFLNCIYSYILTQKNVSINGQKAKNTTQFCFGCFIAKIIAIFHEKDKMLLFCANLFLF